MLAKGLPELMVDYINWRARYVGERPRTVTVELGALAGAHWKAREVEIWEFLEKVRKGDDLTPHLSLEPHTRGYAPAAQAKGATAEDKWSDKDFLLHTMGYHHFHVGTTLEAAGHVNRTDEVILARVTRDQFDVVAAFDHSVFDLTSPERARLWAVHEQIVFRNVPPGSVVMGALIATSGHSVHAVSYADHCMHCIASMDPQLDDREFVNSLYSQIGTEPPAKPKPAWWFHHLDLAIYDEAKPAFFVIKKGWN